MSFDKAVWLCFKSVHFSKKLGCLSSAAIEILAFSSHCSVKFQPILDCFMPYFKLKHEDSENIKTDHADSHFQHILNETEKPPHITSCNV